MQGTSLAGRSILIVEDEPLIALDLVKAFKQAGAVVLATRSLADATPLAEQMVSQPRSSTSGWETMTPVHCACDWNSGVSPSSCTVDTASQPAEAESSFRNPPVLRG